MVKILYNTKKQRILKEKTSAKFLPSKPMVCWCLLFRCLAVAKSLLASLCPFFPPSFVICLVPSCRLASRPHSTHSSCAAAQYWKLASQSDPYSRLPITLSLYKGLHALGSLSLRFGHLPKFMWQCPCVRLVPMNHRGVLFSEEKPEGPMKDPFGGGKTTKRIKQTYA